jgi:hypothetical protein
MSEDLNKLSHHAGTFGEYRICGDQYECESGELAWHITMSNLPVRDYWVTGGAFFSMGYHRVSDSANDTLIQPLGVAKDIDHEEKNAILKAITEWEEVYRTKRAQG